MTAFIKIFAAAFLLTIGFSTATIAQNLYESNQSSLLEEKSTTISNTANYAEKADASDPSITSKFTSMFPKATNQIWASGANNIWVSFINDGRKAKVSYSPKGAVNYTIIDCGIENLPKGFRKSITNDYAGYRLFNAIEITAYHTVVYQAVLENSKGFVTLKYTSDGVEEIQHLNKQ